MRGRSTWVLTGLLGMVAGTGFLASCLDTQSTDTGNEDEQTEQTQHTDLKGSDGRSKVSVVSASLVAEDAPFVAIGHGSVILPGGKVVQPTADLVRKVQDHYLKRLEQSADAATKQELQTRRSAVATQRVAAGSQAETNANAGLIDFLVDAVKPEDATFIKDANGFFKNALIPDSVVGAPSANGVSGTTQALGTGNSGTAYMNECVAAGVPRPPTWGTTGSAGWTLRGTLTTPFLSPDKTAKVYTFSNSQGVCVALPRSYSNGVIDLLGIICQGNATGRACFWDSAQNVDIAAGAQIGIPSSTLIGGAQLAGNNQGVCSGCHAGENAFIFHPRESAMATAISLAQANGWVVPLVDPSWPQNYGPGKEVQTTAVPANQQACTSCHNKAGAKRFPKGLAGMGYCSIVSAAVGPSPLGTMPPPGGNSSAYTAHAQRAAGMCVNKPAATGFNGVGSGLWSNWFAPSPEMPRTGDFNGDGRSDIVTFVGGASHDVYVALSSGSTFGASFPGQNSGLWHLDFGQTGEWVETGDFNGDGMDDIVNWTFGGTARVGRSTGNGFSNTELWGGPVVPFAQWVAIGDFNNDRKDDFAIFTKGTTNDVMVSLSNGSSFGAASKWHDNFSPGAEMALAGDFNGDGRDDIVTFTGGSAGDVFVALSQTNSTFGASTKWHDWFAPNTEIPRVADVDGDGRDDIITFLRGSSGDVYIALSTGSSFAASQLWHTDFAFNTEIPYVADASGDGRGDAITFVGGTLGHVYTAKATNAW
jgi:FG-GAP-like repeat